MAIKANVSILNFIIIIYKRNNSIFSGSLETLALTAFLPLPTTLPTPPNPTSASYGTNK